MHFKLVAFALTGAVCVVGTWWWNSPGSGSGSPTTASELHRDAGMIEVLGGTSVMGSDHVDDAPVRSVVLDAFWIDEHEVTNAQFARFVKATGYVTTAEQAGTAQVFAPAAKLWLHVKGADWRHPHGPPSTITGRDNDPVVQVSWHDAAAYAAWAQKRLPTEAEWECAARGGLDLLHEERELPDQNRPANTWQGPFPFRDDGLDGFRGIAPVASFRANRYGLFDTSGNVAEWCADYYAADYYLGSPQESPPGPSEGTHRVVRGGSWISCDANGAAHRPWVRDSLPPEQANNHTGFRCAK